MGTGGSLFPRISIVVEKVFIVGSNQHISDQMSSMKMTNQN